MDNITLYENLGFFFSCYKETSAVEFCIKNIRNFYKNNPIYISSDGGNDYSYLCDENTKFKLYDDILGYVNNPENKDKEKLIFCCREFLNRLKTSIDFCNTEYIIYYEPDILLRNNIKINKTLSINGSYGNLIHNNVLKLIEKYNPNNKNYNFGACGGSIIKISNLIHVIENTSDELLKEIIHVDPRVSNCDYLLTVLFSIHGFYYDKNIDFIEANRELNWETTNHSIVHQYHQKYNLNYNGKYEKS
jgi:hypothetical protein